MVSSFFAVDAAESSHFKYFVNDTRYFNYYRLMSNSFISNVKVSTIKHRGGHAIIKYFITLLRSIVFRLNVVRLFMRVLALGHIRIRLLNRFDTKHAHPQLGTHIL